MILTLITKTGVVLQPVTGANNRISLQVMATDDITAQSAKPSVVPDSAHACDAANHPIIRPVLMISKYEWLNYTGYLHKHCHCILPNALIPTPNKINII